jgi:predicted signal transduction protein with EAL and GGDEF domain
MFPSDGSDVETLTKNADMAMYRAKMRGKNDFRFFEEEMDASGVARNRLGQELCPALTAGEFEVHYQPIVSIETRRTVGMEALVRWRHPEHGLMSPDKFISLAEETELIDRLGEWVLRQACLDAVKWPADVKVAVNVSPIQFRNSGLAKRVADILAETGLPQKGSNSRSPSRFYSSVAMRISESCTSCATRVSPSHLTTLVRDIRP